MKVAFIAHEPTKEGAGFFLIDAIDFIRSKQIDVLAIVPSRGPFSDALDCRGVECRFVESPWWWTRECKERPPLNATLDAAIVMSSILTDWGADIVYSNTIVAPAGAIAAALTGLPHIWHIHEFAYNPEAIRMVLPKQELAELIKKTSNIVLFNSQSVANEWAGYFEKTLTAIVYNWTRLKADKIFKEVDGNGESKMDCLCDRKFFAHIASISRWKRQIESLHALHNLIIEGHDIVLVFAGPINDELYYEELREYIHRHRLNDNVCFVGYIDDPAVVLSRSVANLVCSNQEPFGRITIESMAVGVPVVGAAAAGTAEIIQNEVSGLLYPPGDVEALTGQMRRLLLDGELRKHLIAQGKERVGRFSSPDQEMEPVLQIMNNLLAEKNPSWPLGQYLGLCCSSIFASSSIPSPMTRFRKKYLRVIKNIIAG